LNVFAADGFVPIDNNISEREMKRIVLNRNYAQSQIMRSDRMRRAGPQGFFGAAIRD